METQLAKFSDKSCPFPASAMRRFIYVLAATALFCCSSPVAKADSSLSTAGSSTESEQNKRNFRLLVDELTTLHVQHEDILIRIIAGPDGILSGGELKAFTSFVSHMPRGRATELLNFFVDLCVEGGGGSASSASSSASSLTAAALATCHQFYQDLTVVRSAPLLQSI